MQPTEHRAIKVCILSLPLLLCYMGTRVMRRPLRRTLEPKGINPSLAQIDANFSKPIKGARILAPYVQLFSCLLTQSTVDHQPPSPIRLG